jgi:hypothetical protein
MRKLIACLMMVALGALVVAAAGQQTSDDKALRARIEARYDVVPIADGIALTPKVRNADVRLIEIADVISINGTTVSGRELRDRVGDDADDILKLSYLDASSRRTLFATSAPAESPQAEVSSESSRRSPRRAERSHGDRVRVFGDVTVREGEEVSGQVVAVLGSVRVNGDVGSDVVSVLGSVDLGEKAVVHGDVVSVGGRVNRTPGAQVRGGVTEVSLSDMDWRVHGAPFLGGLGVLSLFGGLGAVPRLVGTTFRLLLLMLFASMAMILARGSVEGSAHRVGDNPVKAALVGLAAELLFVPVLVLTCIVLAITIIGIPLLFLVPFAVLFLMLLALAGFTGTALAIGQWARRRFGLGSAPGFPDIWIGILIILLPTLLGRLIGLSGIVGWPISLLLLAAGTGLEFLAWSTGLGAILSNIFSRWQARRAVRTVVPPPAVQ